LIRFGKVDNSERDESNWRATQFVRSRDTSITLSVPHPGTYLLACYSEADGLAYVEVINPAPRDPPSALSNILALTHSNFSSTAISANGTVLNANNPVTCTLNPVGADGTSPDPGGGDLRQTQTALATVTGSTWAVAFAPLPSPGTQNPTFPTGSYVLEATAPNEGTVSSTGDV
jgi:hypothetical protein